MSEQDQTAEFPKRPSYGNGTEVGYFVEARYNYWSPQVIAGLALDNRWQRLPLEKAEGFGVPVDMMLNKFSEGLVNYAAAEALRWLFHAIAEAERGGFCLETRIVKVKTEYTHEANQVGAYEHVGGDSGKRSARKPTEDT